MSRALFNKAKDALSFSQSIRDRLMPAPQSMMPTQEPGPMSSMNADPAVNMRPQIGDIRQHVQEEVIPAARENLENIEEPVNPQDPMSAPIMGMADAGGMAGTVKKVGTQTAKEIAQQLSAGEYKTLRNMLAAGTIGADDAPVPMGAFEAIQKKFDFADELVGNAKKGGKSFMNKLGNYEDVMDFVREIADAWDEVQGGVVEGSKKWVPPKK